MKAVDIEKTLWYNLAIPQEVHTVRCNESDLLKRSFGSYIPHRTSVLKFAGSFGTGALSLLRRRGGAFYIFYAI